MSAVLPSGEQWTIRHGDAEAVITQVGGTLRTFTVAGQPVVAGFTANEVCPHGRGQQLMPWPNRIADGRYTWAGVEHQLALTEPARGNALHGLVAWQPWELVERTDAALTVATRLFPQVGWAWVLDLSCRYALDDEGLTVTPSATNRSAEAAPFGYGAHPYLTAGEERVDDVRLVAPAASFLDVDPERLLPVGTDVASSTRPVDGTDADLRADIPLGGRALDLAYTDLPREGRWEVTLTGPRQVTLWADAAAFPWLQVFTGDALPEPYRRSSGIAVEPLTCPPNAFATGEGVIALEPGTTWTASWGVRSGREGLSG